MKLEDVPERLPAYVYDLRGLAEHVASVRTALGPTELYYAAKANPDAEILRTVAPHVDGVEVSSGGELTHVRETLPHTPLAFGGPGKTDDELALAQRHADRIHVESPRELSRLSALGPADVLLRANLPFRTPGAALAMSGPFGMDEDALAECARRIPETGLTLRGVHAHLASGLGAPAMLDLAARIVDWALPFLKDHGVDDPEINIGGGMAVDYASPAARFDWETYGRGLPTGARLRVEPGRALTAYHGWYVTDVLDVKTTRGDTYAVLRGGTHHLRTPATKGHDHPFEVLTSDEAPTTAASLVGQLCTPKDVFATDVPVPPLAPGDIIAFTMAGAYAWNISHHDFLMHPKPTFHYLR
ncbi:type III PLP-dependent enzyme domain-containing protein [Actinomadura algeriensis]|uniref:Diaminopimelate decarboxylase n=1 Tax=Actinomadura algeriensis TaxID=1679523 RepID=A0ABR9JV20_9ACTN|nr:alanine racemase [Actinomadura algeriensis]MBE1534395.1 diaminopimelate decarboxylase [Actinomadura algeriensis]